MTQNRNRALDYLEAANAAQHALQAQYDQPANQRDMGTIASLHQAIGHAFKAAEVHATLAVAQEVQRLTLRAFPDGTAMRQLVELPDGTYKLVS